MKIETDESGVITLSEVFESIAIQTNVGKVYISQRDGGLELVFNSKIIYVFKDKSQGR